MVDNSLGLSWISSSVSCSFENGIFLVGLLLTACFEHIFFANHTEQSRVRTKQLLFHDDVIIILFVLLGKLYAVKWNQNNMIYKLFSLLQNLIYFFLAFKTSQCAMNCYEFHAHSILRNIFFLFPNFFVNIIQTQTCYFRRWFESSTRYCKNFQCYCFFSFVCCFFNSCIESKNRNWTKTQLCDCKVITGKQRVETSHRTSVAATSILIYCIYVEL